MIQFGFGAGIPKVMSLKAAWIDASPEPAKVSVGKQAWTAKDPFGASEKRELRSAFFLLRLCVPSPIFPTSPCLLPLTTIQFPLLPLFLRLIFPFSTSVICALCAVKI
jgi:hypothetical protein